MIFVNESTEATRNVACWELVDSKVKNSVLFSNSQPGAFAKDSSYNFWKISSEITFPYASPPTIKLPLRIHLAGGSILGCSITQNDCFDQIIHVVNKLWSQAGIEWELVEVMPLKWDIDDVQLERLKSEIWSLHRDPTTGMMTGKEKRRNIFLNNLIKEHTQFNRSFDIFMFDFIGQESQGCCISRASHSIILGHRSTKGYPTPTLRPLPCLGKTCAHELGHALSLDHPKGRVFGNGVSHTEQHGNQNNLMSGGQDKNGGGGELLEKWQILQSRYYAMEFLEKN